MPDSLTPKQHRFVEEYCVDWNGKQAAIRAGYSIKGSEVQASQLLTIPKVRAAVDAKRAKYSEDLGISKAWVLGKLKTNAERALQAEAVLDSEGEPTGTYRYEGNVANRALELLGKEQGMFREKVEVTGKDGGPIEVQEWKWGKRVIKF